MRADGVGGVVRSRMVSAVVSTSTNAVDGNVVVVVLLVVVVEPATDVVVVPACVVLVVAATVVVVVVVVVVPTRARPRQRRREALRIGGVRVAVELAAVEHPVEIAVDADARPRSRRHAGEGDLLAGGAGQVAHLGRS